MPATESTVLMTRPTPSSPSDGVRAVESANVGSRNLSMASVRPNGSWSTPRKIAPKASTLMAIFMGTSRSAMKWPGPGKPTSVSSFSPVIGFSGSPWCRCPVSIQLPGLGARLAQEGAEDHPERVDAVRNAPM